MRLSDKDFFEKEIDRSIPALAEASKLYRSGKQAEAEKAFADYLKTVFPDKRIDTLTQEVSNLKTDVMKVDKKIDNTNSSLDTMKWFLPLIFTILSFTVNYLL